MATYRFKLARTDPSAEKLFTLDLDSRMTVLDALFPRDWLVTKSHAKIAV